MFSVVLARLLPESHNLYGNSLDFKLNIYKKKKVSTMFKGKGVSFLGWFPNIICDNTMILILSLSSQYEIVSVDSGIFNSLDLT